MASRFEENYVSTLEQKKVFAKQIGWTVAMVNRWFSKRRLELDIGHDMAGEDHNDCENRNDMSVKTINRLSSTITNILLDFYNKVSVKPNLHLKQKLAKMLGLTLVQVNSWFYRYRRRMMNKNSRKRRMLAEQLKKSPAVYRQRIMGRRDPFNGKNTGL